jgi:hypothetical protein
MGHTSDRRLGTVLVPSALVRRCDCSSRLLDSHGNRRRTSADHSGSRAIRPPGETEQNGIGDVFPVGRGCGQTRVIDYGVYSSVGSV